MDKAQEQFEIAVNVRRRVQGPSHRDTRKAMSDLAAVDNTNTIATMAAIADAYRSLGMYAQAEEVTKKMWDLQRKLLGANSMEDVRSYAIRMRLGQIYEGQRKYKKAEEAFRTIQKILLRENGSLANQRGRSILTHIGWAVFPQERYAEAETILDAPIMTDFYDAPIHPEGAIRHNWAGLLGAILVAQKKYAAAEDRLLA